MGVSSDAILFYGIDLGEEFDVNQWEDRYWETEFYKRKGLADADYSVQSATRESSPVLIDNHCHLEYPIYFVTARESHVVASRGYPEVITTLEIKPEWDSQIKEFCEFMDLPYQQPKWILASYMG